MWSLRRRSNLASFSLLIQSHLNFTNYKPTHCLNSSNVTELGHFSNKTLLGSFIYGFRIPFSSSNTNSRFPSTHIVENENTEDENDVNDNGDEYDNFEVVNLGIKDENLIRDVEKILGFLHEFESNAAEAKHKLDHCGVPVSSGLVVEVLSRIRNDWAAAFTFFLWAGRQPGYGHSLREYNMMISILGKLRKFDTAWALIDEMRGRKTGPSLVTPQTLVIMIRRYCAAHDVAKAINTFYAFKRFRFKIEIDEFQDLLSALCRYKNVQDAEHLLFCNESTFPFDTKSFNILLNGWCNMVGNLREAKRFWRDMSKRGIVRDAISYGSMITCYSKAGNLNDVLKLFNQMKELGIEPDKKVYNAVVYALAKGKCVKEAVDLVKTMEEKGFVPDAVTYNSLIKPLCKVHRIEDARVVFEEMLQRGISPSIRTYHAFFPILKTAEEIFKLLDQMKQTRCPPVSDTYIMLIRKFCRWRQHENVFKLWNEMGMNGMSPDRSSYIVLIHGLFLNGKLDEAFKYYEEMKTKGFRPEPKTDEMLKTWISNKNTVRPLILELKNNQLDCNHSGKNTRDSSKTVGVRKNFLKEPETRSVMRERGFSFW